MEIQKENKEYIAKPFPKWKYRKDGIARLVADAAAEKSLGSEWADSPKDFGVITHPGAQAAAPKDEIQAFKPKDSDVAQQELPMKKGRSKE